ncbi:phosphoribosylanthranilate isomerase [Collimonas sp. OK307]|uniref:hypothetical protein n=1 Tax=Collimonas sp. OK307 TaxID=1801620 RepID=UPI0008E327EB|nr:hypothetical protein [Collimonas sp. OK307]SFI38060.1 phosphoribosylanthranilate isomerase [Collimonas sp. OK307]
MLPTRHTPAFITFTGVDRVELIPGMQALAARYPIEWGVLIESDREGQSRFPATDVRRAIQCAGLRLSVHICGHEAREIAAGKTPPLDLSGFARMQINHSFNGSSKAEIQNCHTFAARHGMRAALQCQHDFPSDSQVDWLYDVSFGTGVQPKIWPQINIDHPLCGYSGGFSADNLASIVPTFPVHPGVVYWIDMESGVRTDDTFDLDKCAAICQQVFDR